MAAEWRVVRVVYLEPGERWPLYRVDLTDGGDDAEAEVELVAEIDVRGERMDPWFCANGGPAFDWLLSDEGFDAALAAATGAGV